MKRFPPIGTRIRLKKGTRFAGTTGTVTRHYPGYQDFDVDAGEYYEQDDMIEVEVDVIPEGWFWTDTKKFCPDLSEVEEI